MGGEMFSPTFAMNVVDISGCVILLIAWKRSLLQYRSTVGVFSLEQRFQLSEVYTWSRHLIPAVLLASFTKMMVIVIIWILITGNYTGNDAAIWVIIYNNILNIYTVIMPFVILVKHNKVRQKLMHTQNQKPMEMRKTIDGKVIPNRYITAKYSIAQSLRNRIFSISIGAVISILSMIYAQVIHLVNFHIIAITCLNIVDMIALIVLVLSSKFSIKHYKNTAGVTSLEQRFQISDVYIWTQALIPPTCLAFLLKFTYVIVVWMLQTVEDSMSYQITFTHFFQNVLDLLTIAIPFLVSSNHRRLNKLKLRNRGRVNPIDPVTHVKTLDGKPIHLKTTFHDHFDFLKNHWK
ncbi:hypothetical protein GCK72_018902 [Caenorhabditis remanei]|uniref:Uncharacterized protein n=1 Tax=Caenorhabditis remanei TaxID=31234 RepID=A0A6A5GB39_CAERE|nr:hypothetical protein GCK72_018902 [Caenorhabditis remanei]KAF1752348.1 hypothetical protein GCK72_018902 [Caenorhabditis remanei]